METKVRQSNYITILGWMVSELGLSGSRSEERRVGKEC